MLNNLYRLLNLYRHLVVGRILVEVGVGDNYIIVRSRTEDKGDRNRVGTGESTHYSIL